jgi:hypothetical protein
MGIFKLCIIANVFLIKNKAFWWFCQGKNNFFISLYYKDLAKTKLFIKSALQIAQQAIY